MRKKVLFLANHFITLYSFRKELIRKLVEDGHDVYLSIPESEQNEYFKQLGCKIIDTKIDRRGVNPLKDLALVLQYKNIMDKLKPDIIFSYTIKPNIYGTIASNGKYRQVCNITGTGATFLKKSLVSEICKFLYRISIKNCYKVFFQNKGDRDFFVKNNLVKENYAMLPGSGCNLDEHLYVPMPDSEIIRFIFIGRVMKLKGIDEYLEAAKVIKAKYPNTEFLIAGWIEDEKYKSIIDKYVSEKIVNYIGFRKDIGDWISKCHCTILPSHGGEGIPNVLLESAATGRICIGSRINGTEDVIDEGVTGYFFETGDSCDLADKIQNVIGLQQIEKNRMGLLAREKIEKEFNRNIILQKYLDEVEKL